MKPIVLHRPYMQNYGRILFALAASLVFSAGILYAQTSPVSPTEILPFSAENVVVSFYSPLTTVNALTLSANGVIIDTTSIANFTLPPNGGVAHIVGDWLPNGVIRARSIDTVNASVLPGIVELTGRLHTFGMDFFTVTDNEGVVHTISVNGTSLAMPDAQIGQSIRVFAVAVAPQLWFARGVSVLNMDRIQPPIVTPEVEAVAPVTTPEADESSIIAPVSTPEVQDDDDSNDSGNRDDNDDDNSGSGSGNDDSDSDDDDDDDDNSGSGG